jgi:hypothetical protein
MQPERIMTLSSEVDAPLLIRPANPAQRFGFRLRLHRRSITTLLF